MGRCAQWDGQTMVLSPREPPNVMLPEQDQKPISLVHSILNGSLLRQGGLSSLHLEAKILTVWLVGGLN